MSLITLRQAAERFDLSYDALRRIAAAGLLPDVGPHAGKPVISTDVARRLQARSAVALHDLLPTTTGAATMAVLRVDAAKPVPDEDRPFIGFHADLTPEDLLEALRGWWVGKPEKIAQAGILPVTLGGFVVAVLTGLSGWDRKVTENGLTRHRFDARLAGCISDLSTPANMITVGPADDLRIAGLLLGKRLTSTAGGPIAYVTAASR
ncbi:hypothetical protein Nocox_00265 [Nonomuraea coxensis DSM 45129]|uniref:Helix-turn-helix domain-containing protein n=1 Tax=Nonomuraea coxensis DSM 45129 TaxID=1122611 RepID=A0ABX8TSD5_9ACTN|nr:hypothetical protein [Nonomuraea coxensis]QYC37692.1 hypothetical protein Nocox_00265 [Nonomuraea coxensis DSM 45129]